MGLLQYYIGVTTTIVGFNSRSFDDKLLRANGMDVTTTVDLLEEIRLSAFGSPNWWDTPKGYSYSLDAIARANGSAKTGDGAIAPIWWQRGERQKVKDYCRADVEILHDMYLLFLRGELLDPNTGATLKPTDLVLDTAPSFCRLPINRND